MYVCLNVKPLKNVYTFCTKISNSVNNDIHHGKNQPHQEVGGSYIIEKHYDAWVPPVIGLIDIAGKNNTLITTSYGAYFCILGSCIQNL